jgi:hypothetical protein
VRERRCLREKERKCVRGRKRERVIVIVKEIDRGGVYYRVREGYVREKERDMLERKKGSVLVCVCVC